ncbi:hypothetical protein AB0N97_16335 [Streptomyces collinus]|uniref:hypothetical protein n=1 Tax=Streptomyces collinus TaxID=42684 RepID=UPI003417C3EE
MTVKGIGVSTLVACSEAPQQGPPGRWQVDKSGWCKTGGYYLAKELVPVFAEALRVLKEKGSQS